MTEPPDMRVIENVVLRREVMLIEKMASVVFPLKDAPAKRPRQTRNVAVETSAIRWCWCVGQDSKSGDKVALVCKVLYCTEWDAPFGEGEV